MSFKVVVPSVGESITEGIIANWLKKNGDYVQSGEALFELETDKITTEVPAQSSGVLTIAVPAGTTVSIGSEVARIEPSASGTTAAGNGKSTVASATPSVPAQARPLQPNKPTMPVTTPATTPNVPSVAPQAMPPRPSMPPPTTSTPLGSPMKLPDGLPPSVRKMLIEKQLDPTPSPGRTAPTAPATSYKPVPTNPGERETRQRMSGLRQKIAQRLVASQQETATLTTFNEADMSIIMELRERHKEVFKAKHGVGLGIMSFFVKAAVAALKQMPQVNARIEGTDIVFNNYYDIGIAVSTDRGLVVPIIRNADQLSFADIERKVADLALRARDGKLTIEELQGGTFSITNGGVFGSLLATPIINPPQGAILGMHAIKKRPVVVGEQIVARPMMYLALSYDHRLIDGKESVTFLVAVKEYIENPAKFLLELN